MQAYSNDAKELVRKPNQMVIEVINSALRQMVYLRTKLDLYHNFSSRTSKYQFQACNLSFRTDMREEELVVADLMAEICWFNGVTLGGQKYLETWCTHAREIQFQICGVDFPRQLPPPF